MHFIYYQTQLFTTRRLYRIPQCEQNFNNESKILLLLLYNKILDLKAWKQIRRLHTMAYLLRRMVGLHFSVRPLQVAHLLSGFPIMYNNNKNPYKHCHLLYSFCSRQWFVCHLARCLSSLAVDAVFCNHASHLPSSCLYSTVANVL